MKNGNRARAILEILAAAFLQSLQPGTANTAQDTVDFRYAPPEWQTAICLPDDPHKSLVDRSGELIYHYCQGGREFATRVGVEVTGGAVWQKQELLSPRVPIVRTLRDADGLEIMEEAFAVTDLRQANAPASSLRRVDSGGTNSSWAKPSAGLDPSLKNIAVNMGGSIRYELMQAITRNQRAAQPPSRLRCCHKSCGRKMPAGVMMPVMRSGGVTSKPGL